VEYPEIDPTGPEWEVRSYFDWVGAARREVRPWVDVAVWVHIPKRPGRRSVDRLPQEDTFLAEHRAWEIAEVLVAGGPGQPAHNRRYGNVVTAPGPASVMKHG
jgi:hypothetical protein